MLCTLTRGSQSIAVDLLARCTWRTPPGGEAGDATVFVPFSSEAASADYIDPDGGSRLTIDAGSAGVWRGIITRPKFTEHGVSLVAFQTWSLLNRRLTRWGIFTDIPIGVIAGYAINDAVVGMPELYAGAATYESSGPVLSQFSFQRRTAWEILRELMDQSDGELHVDNDTGRIDWCGPFAASPRYAPLLIAGEDLRDIEIERDIMNQVAEVIGSSGTNIQRYTASRGDLAARGWAAQSTVSVNDSRTDFLIASAAEGLLASASAPEQFLTANVPSEHFGLRERAYVRCLVPWDAFTGRMFSARVLERTVDDASPLMAVRMQVVGLDVEPPNLTMHTRNAPGKRPSRWMQIISDLISERASSFSWPPS